MDYIAYARTSYFKVKDEELLNKIADSYQAEVVHRDDRAALLFNYGGIPGWNVPEQWEDHPLWTDEYDDTFFFRLLATTMEDGEGAFLTEVGTEGMRYFTGIVVAITSKGNVEWRSLDDFVSELADQFSEFKFGPRDY